MIKVRYNQDVTSLMLFDGQEFYVDKDQVEITKGTEDTVESLYLGQDAEAQFKGASVVLILSQWCVRPEWVDII